VDDDDGVTLMTVMVMRLGFNSVSSSFCYVEFRSTLLLLLLRLAVCQASLSTNDIWWLVILSSIIEHLYSPDIW